MSIDRIVIFRRLALAGVMVAFLPALFFVGGCGETLVLDQSSYEDVSELVQKEDSVVRLYGSLWFTPNSVAIHSWFLYKRGSEQQLTRWEAYPGPRGQFGFVRKNGLPPIFNFGGGVLVLGECNGAQAEAVIDFIENESPMYPYRNDFNLIHGPNCNTYAQWVLEQTQWDVEMPVQAIGKDWPLSESVGAD